MVISTIQNSSEENYNVHVYPTNMRAFYRNKNADRQKKAYGAIFNTFNNTLFKNNL